MANAEHLKEYNRKIAAGEIERAKPKNPLEKCQEDPKSMRKAVNAKCYDCIFDNKAGGTWREQVRNCEQSICPLYQVRPK